MRIISGKNKGKKIIPPVDKNTRPLRDIVKESIFNLIKHSNKFNFNLENSHVLDLFSGSGSFGLECISRGASKVVFVENYNKALKYFHESQKLSQSDSLSKYSLLMASAFQKFSSGKKEVLWDAIQSFYKASNIYPLNGEPHYYIGETYLKLGDKDFDLIIDSYDKALSLNLPEPLEEKVKTSKKEALRRRDLLKNFWK